jgi:hypothetical protein
MPKYKKLIIAVYYVEKFSGNPPRGQGGEIFSGVL